MDTGQVLEVTVRALWMSLVLCGPILIMLLVVGLVIGIIQAATSVNESAVAFVPKLIAVVLVIAVIGPLTLPYYVEYFKGAIRDITIVTK
jgi:flagellar biosynthetic protein FliQ